MNTQWAVFHLAASIGNYSVVGSKQCKVQSSSLTVMVNDPRHFRNLIDHEHDTACVPSRMNRHVAFYPGVLLKYRWVMAKFDTHLAIHPKVGHALAASTLHPMFRLDYLQTH